MISKKEIIIIKQSMQAESIVLSKRSGQLEGANYDMSVFNYSPTIALKRGSSRCLMFWIFFLWQRIALKPDIHGIFYSPLLHVRGLM